MRKSYLILIAACCLSLAGSAQAVNYNAVGTIFDGQANVSVPYANVTVYVYDGSNTYSAAGQADWQGNYDITVTLSINPVGKSGKVDAGNTQCDGTTGTYSIVNTYEVKDVTITSNLIISAGIGMVNNLTEFGCAGDYLPFQTTAIEVFYWSVCTLNAILGAQFSISNYIGNQPWAAVNEIWYADMVTGTPDAGISLIWNTPQPGPLIHIGTIEVYPDTQEPNYAMCIAGYGGGGAMIVNDQGDLVDVPGNCFVMNCEPGGPFGECLCDNVIPVEPVSWGTIKALY